MQMLLPPGTRTLRPGDDTGLTMAVDGSPLPGANYPLGWYNGMFLTVPGPNNMPSGNYRIVAQGGTLPAVATLLCTLVVHPSDASYLSNVPNGDVTILVPPDVWLAEGTYDIVV